MEGGWNRTSTRAALLAVLLALSIGCAQKKSATIMVITPTGGLEYWEKFNHAVKASAEAAGIQTELAAPQSVTDYTEQAQMVENAIARHVQGIIVSPAHQLVLTSVLQKAVQARIPVVIVGSPVALSSKDFAAFIGWDEEEAGRLAARRFITLLGGKGELGVVGGLLTIAWMLRLWWELGTFPMAGQSEESTRPPALPLLLGLALAAIGLNCVFSIDWSAQTAWIIIELFKRLLFLLALLTGICVAGIRSFNRQEPDDRPAPWLHAAVLVGLGLFLLHNLIDFSMFEIGPMYLFALLAGSALGMRFRERPALRFGKSGALVAFILSAIGWVVTAGGVLIPITEAEELAQDADHEVRTARNPDAPPQTAPNLANLERAEEDFLKAFRLVPINADYAFRAEQSAILRRGSPILMRQLIDEAQAADPSSVRYRLARAVLKMSEGDLSGAAADYEQILELDPHNLEIRLQFAALLDKQGRSREAREQYQKVLEFNDKLAADEIRRLSKDQVDQIQQRLAR